MKIGVLILYRILKKLKNFLLNILYKIHCNRYQSNNKAICK